MNKRLGSAVSSEAERLGNDAQGSSSQSRKRPRLRLNDQQNIPSDIPSTSNANQSSAACDQCRFRKVRCDRQQPECSNCRKGGIACNQTSNFKRVNHTKQLQVPVFSRTHICLEFQSLIDGGRVPPLNPMYPTPGYLYLLDVS